MNYGSYYFLLSDSELAPSPPEAILSVNKNDTNHVVEADNKSDEEVAGAVVEEFDADQAQLEQLRQKFALLRLDELRAFLRGRNCTIGPLNAGNRCVYELKLARLEARQQQQQKREPNSISRKFALVFCILPHSILKKY